MSVNTSAAVTCPICRAPSRRYCRKESARYFACTSCNTLFQHPMPAADVMAKYVDQEYADGAYQDYVRARDLKLLTFRSRARQILARGEELGVQRAATPPAATSWRPRWKSGLTRTAWRSRRSPSRKRPTRYGLGCSRAT